MSKKKNSSLTIHQHDGYSIGTAVPRTASPQVRPVFYVDPVYGCHLWRDKLDSRGYGRWRGKLAHRAAWELINGPLPKCKPELDHLCQRRNCVNVDHLEPVTRRENERRKVWRRRSVVGFSVRDKCPNGHSMSLYGMPTPERGKVCRRCVTHGRK